MRNAALARADRQRLADRFERLDLGWAQGPERGALRTRLLRRQKNIDTADREGQRAQCRVLEESPPCNTVHDFHPCSFLIATLFADHRSVPHAIPARGTCLTIACAKPRLNSRWNQA